jgi:hypothetical protein
MSLVSLIIVVVMLSFSMMSSAMTGTASILREEASIAFGGVHEKWRLEWTEKPKEACVIKGDDSETCPCAGFAYAEYGPADLVRVRDEKEIERFHLAPLFQSGDLPIDGTMAVLQHWPLEEADFSASSPSVEVIRKRVPVKIMSMADYNHDGWSSEFVLQIGAGPCGHRSAVLLGLTPRNPTLHAFGTVKSPGKPLVLDPEAWRLLGESKHGTRYTSLACGDHGAKEQHEVDLQFEENGIRAIRETFACRKDFKKGKLIHRSEL